MSNMMTVKLDNTNYIVWKHQITMVLETYSLFELLEDPQLVPDKYLKDLSGNYTTIMNPDFLIWKSKEKALLTFISSTLTPSVLALTVGCTSAMEVWKVLESKTQFLPWQQLLQSLTTMVIIRIFITMAIIRVLIEEEAEVATITEVVREVEDHINILNSINFSKLNKILVQGFGLGEGSVPGQE
nr:hypothetical protein CFP56_08547 [Quercus suber]